MPREAVSAALTAVNLMKTLKERRLACQYLCQDPVD